jgi:uncharacterized protein YbbC (DUF1343 family)
MATERIITAVPRAIAPTAIFATGEEKRLVSFLLPINLRAINQEKFTGVKSTNLISLLLFCFLLIYNSLEAQIFSRMEVVTQSESDIQTGASRISEYLPKIKGKRIGIVANHTSLIGKTHLVDTLLSLGLKVNRVFAPEHGFRGDADAGETIVNNKDAKTGLSVISLYGKNKKPLPDQIGDLDVILFDIQDVGVRFYTYISTMSYVMEACAEQNKQFIVLDRPNPNGHYVDGPILEPAFSSFVGLHPIPVVHGMTVGEYAQMVNGEGWLKDKIKCQLTVIQCLNWTHKRYFQVPVHPSPNLRTMNSIYLYPSLCFFEGTIVSVGRGTKMPFEIIGYPGFQEGTFKFTPQSSLGSKQPMYENQECTGFDLSSFGDNFVRDSGGLYLFWMINFYKSSQKGEAFFTPFFDKLAGTDKLRKQIMEGKTEDEIRESWKPGLIAFKAIRQKYLLYPDTL